VTKDLGNTKQEGIPGWKGHEAGEGVIVGDWWWRNGTQTSLDLADLGLRLYLLEGSPTIGGRIP
jgi:hypothetical protein